MKDFIYPEMMVHTALCTHKLPSDIAIISDNAENLMNEVSRHKDFSSTTCSDIKTLDDNSNDVVLYDLNSDAASLAHVNRVVKDDGLVVLKHNSLDDIKSNTILMEILASYFKIIMPFSLEDGSTLLLASKQYHPTADIILQRSDLIDGLEYYNCDIHVSSFSMPNYIRKNYLGVIKN
ncbi:MAG: spermidine synthase [Campylobacterota bacterium]|nr:spermidine synthase [Campylobacterota bacterium]